MNTRPKYHAVALLMAGLILTTDQCQAAPTTAHSPSPAAAPVIPNIYPGRTPGPQPDHKPNPTPDPKAMASVGRDKHSAVLHIDWAHERRFQITYNDGTGEKTFILRAQAPFGGWLDIPVVVTGPANIYIFGEPVLPPARDNGGLAFCSVKWNGEVVDWETVEAGGVGPCEWSVYL